MLSPSAATKAGLSDDAVTFTLCKFAHGGGLTLGIEDHNRIRNADLRCLLVDTRRIGATSEVMRQYLETFPIEARESNQTFHKRRVWHQPNDGKMPDAFFSYLQKDGPALLLNDAGAYCTNTIHRVFFQPNVSRVNRMAIAISLLSSFSQLSAEIEGRSYGSGVLKHELGEAASIKIVLPQTLFERSIVAAFSCIDALLRKGLGREARKEADKSVADWLNCQDMLPFATLSQALEDARARRQRLERARAKI